VGCAGFCEGNGRSGEGRGMREVGLRGGEECGLRLGLGRSGVREGC